MANWRLLASFAGVMIAKCFEYAFTKEGMLKLDEVRPGVKKKNVDSKTFESNGKAQGIGNGDAHSPSQSLSFSWTGVVDAVELAHTTRGLSFHFGRDTPIPVHRRPLHRPTFLKATFRSFLIHFLELDILESTLKLFPGVGSPSGGSIFYPTLAFPLRLLVSTTIHILTGSALVAGFNMVYDLITFFAVGLLNSSPQNWPPVMDDPWHADSMHRFWSKDWHQLLRRTFLIYGGYPARYLSRCASTLLFRVFGAKSNSKSTRQVKVTRMLEDVASVFGIFLASGLWHECTMYAMGRGFEWAAIVFFIGQAALLIGERLWKKLSGRKVAGLWGRIWVYLVIFIGPQMMGE
jgi:hypothetical protein